MNLKSNERIDFVIGNIMRKLVHLKPNNGHQFLDCMTLLWIGTRHGHPKLPIIIRLGYVIIEWYTCRHPTASATYIDLCTVLRHRQHVALYSLIKHNEIKRKREAVCFARATLYIVLKYYRTRERQLYRER